MKNKRHFHWVTKKGTYTTQARKLARIMVDSGCARGKVGSLMGQVGEIFGVHIDRVMSCRTVSRAILEGGIASKIQITYEMSMNQGVTISADSTSNRGQNIESSHMNMRAPNYKDGFTIVDSKSVPKVRFLGVEKTLDHLSAESVKSWKARIEECVDLFNRSPLARRLERKYSFREFLKILKGMHGDHASTEKSSAKGMEGLKREASIEELGEQALKGKEYLELIHYLGAWNAKKIAQAGGVEGWEALSVEEQAARDARLMSEIVAVLGKEAYDALSPTDRREIDLFIWAGCCMHKDQNSFKGGNAEMMAEWPKLGLPGPILLANKDNAAILRNLLDPAVPKDSPMSAQELRAFEASTRGGVKTCALAGAIFNNKDDKKGQADRHVDFMSRKTGQQHARFPDTSNTRFASHGEAAAELITYLPEYREMMDTIHWSKAQPSLTNIEKNLRDALNCPSTITELCAMVLYQQIITLPYLRHIHGPGTENVNVLDLGLLHHSLRDHVQAILDDPDIIFGSDTGFSCTSTLDGREWQNPAAIASVFALMPTLPHIKPITMAFFRGALPTWIRFSSEFAPGGLIDLCSATEKQAAWMPSTNDANEGTLGAYRVAMRGKPSLTVHQYNALAMFRRNQTQEFMDTVFDAADYAFIMREARKIDASGLEALHRQEIVDFRLKTAEMQKNKALLKAQKALEDRCALRRVKLVLGPSAIAALTIQKIHEQLNTLRLRGVPNILANSKYPRKAEKITGLEAAVQLYLLNTSQYPLPSDPEADMEGDALTVDPEIVDDWGAEEDIEMEE
ncbi:hypothetical protein C8J57DRAFT_1042576 [Mycena rebaudengoi]|nr:hypothetical protein C8J57DRAFT_1042576 [Mycena rebaudengoi]